MLRGLYTGASALLARSRELDVVANNLANVNTVGFKRGEAVFRAFPEMVIRRVEDNGVFQFPLGSIDKRPIVGKISTGVEVRDVYTDMGTQGSLRQTSNPLDVAIFGEGFFVVQSPDKMLYTRNGSFSLDKNNVLVTKNGFPVMGQNGKIYLQHNNFYIDQNGTVFARKELSNPINRPTQTDDDVNKPYEAVDRIRLVDFPYKENLKKLDNSFYEETNESGKAGEDSVKAGSQMRAGFLEMANVNPVYEMVKMIEADRGFEASQKTVVAADQSLDKLINSMARLA